MADEVIQPETAQPETVEAPKAESGAWSGPMIKIRLHGSPICCPVKHKIIIKSLGLKKINRIVERPDTPAFRGIVKKVPHLLEIVKE